MIKTSGCNQAERSDNLNEHSEVFAMVISQFLIHKGTEKFGNKEREAAKGDVWQLHDRRSFRPRHSKDLTKNEIEQALNLIMLTEEKKRWKNQGKRGS